MHIDVYTRHSNNCPKRANSNYKQCHCPKWLYWHISNREFRRSAKTRTWSEAERSARSLEITLEEGKPLPRREAVKIEEAAQAFVQDKRDQRFSDDTISKYQREFEKQLLSWCQQNNIVFLADMTLQKLRSFRSTWTVSSLTSSLKQSRLKAFFRFCLAAGWVKYDQAAGLSKIKVARVVTDYFTPDEYQKILDATDFYEDPRSRSSAEHIKHRQRLRTLIELMRWSGLAIRDAVCLERSKLDDKNNLLLHRRKTGGSVFVPLPEPVAEALRNIPPGRKNNPRYFFWSGTSKPKSAVANRQRALTKIFRLADLTHEDGTPKRSYPHMLRDTFAVEALLAGVKLQDVSIFLGHESIRTTEESYSPFVKARQEQLVQTMKTAWKQMPTKPSSSGYSVRKKTRLSKRAD